MLTSKEIRKKYLEFFKKNGHEIIPSSPLVPENDSTLLFVNSGMFPLVPYLLGEPHPCGNRLVNSQKSFRTEDIEEVGDGRHNTFFEMLGNWSLGDYFKKEQLEMWYGFLVEELGLDPKRLYQSFYIGDGNSIPKDKEAMETMKKIFEKYGISAGVGVDTEGKGAFGPGVEIDFEKERIFGFRDKNWWSRGDAVGEPGGGDSETFYDTGKKHDPKFGKHCHVNCDCGRFLEIGNSVFMQFKKEKDGWKELAKKNVDFGGGLERIVMVIQGKDNVFETDLFLSALEKLEEISGKNHKDFQREFEVILDHIKGAMFIIGDGIDPSNIGQGYIVRRLLRRAMKFAMKLGVSGKFIGEIAREYKNIYGGFYKEIEENIEKIISIMEQEEEKFGSALERGEKEFQKLFEKIMPANSNPPSPLAKGEGKFDFPTDENILKNIGKEFFNLFQTYGYPLEIILEMLEEKFDKKILEKNLDLIKISFKENLEKHQELSKTASAGMFKGGLADSSEQTTKLHTTAHLMLAGLRNVLGENVHQKGSNITAERLRFDFSHTQKMTDEEIQKVEKFVNEAIQDEAEVLLSNMSKEEAKNTGVEGSFWEKYPEVVKVYKITGKSGKVYSSELCGGPHIENTKILGKFKIAKEEASSSGVRRIKAILE